MSRSRLSGVDLASDNLSGIDLTDSDLRLADLSSANLQSAHLWRSNMAQAVLRETVLAGASLGRTNLTGCSLDGANLRGADLSFADLSYASLEGAILTGADLSNANLAWADLRGADLRDARIAAASLELATLADADLRGASLLKAKLDGAQFSGAVLDMTLFGDCDLSRVIGLESVHHAGPSIIGVDTLARSGGRVPPTFLGEAGVSEPLISSQDQVRKSPAAHSRVLVVSSVGDGDLAERVLKDLKAEGVASWALAADDEQALRNDPEFLQRTYYYDQLVLVCSTQSLESPHVFRLFGSLAKNGSTGTQTALTLAADDLVYNRQDSLCAALRELSVIDFRGWAEESGYAGPFAALLAALAPGRP